MIKIQTLDRIDNIEHVVKPTIFPDGTSQVWKLPEEVTNSLNIKVTWNFESEVELMHLASLKTLLSGHCHLHVPYLPYARQDKDISNKATFNLHTFAKLLNTLGFNLVTSVDVHNQMVDRWDKTFFPIKNFKNIEVIEIIRKSLEFIQTDALIYPDLGAFHRYNYLFENKKVLCEKTRNQLTGEITGHRIVDSNGVELKTAKRVMIIDDICDGGATFISIAKMLKEFNSELFIDLYVTHGIFSKGKQILHDAGIQNIYCTNSLLKNEDGFKV
jgi:ribose-phosphate pyrophosphokinase